MKNITENNALSTDPWQLADNRRQADRSRLAALSEVSRGLRGALSTVFRSRDARERASQR